MPAVAPQVLVRAIVDAFGEAGFVATPISAASHQPRRFAVAGPTGDTFVLAAYVWTLTFGGRRNLAGEYRIQMTSVRSPLRIDRDGLTVLLGYEPNLRVFAGFDLGRHRVFTTGSPSVQIDIEALKRSETEGLSFHRKSNSEIAVGVRPDQLALYSFNAPEFHRFGREASVLGLLQKAVGLGDVTNQDVATLTTERRRLIQVTSRLSRLASFRREVLFA